MMQIEELFRIWDRFENSKATEVVFEAEGQKFCLKKEGRVIAPAVQNISPQTASAAFNAAPVNGAENASRSLSEEIQIPGTIVRAPFVGTFYRSPAPGEEPFVRLGHKVSKGDVIGIIEAMKLMNEITAPCDGTVTEIFIEDATLVEYDQLLVCIGE